MKIRQNLHIHSLHSCDSACAKLTDICEDMSALGMTEFGISDHYHTRYNMCDIQSARNDFLVYRQSDAFHFGVELSCMAQWECDRIAAGEYERIGDDPVYGLRFVDPPDDQPKPAIDMDAADIARLGIEYVIGGVHWPLHRRRKRLEMFDDYFEQHMFLIENPLVDILAHPWYSIDMAAGGYLVSRDRKDIEYDAFMHIPQWMHDALMNALLKHNKCAEINIPVLLDLPDKCAIHYWRTFAAWREAGVKFTIGNDQHSANCCKRCFAAIGQLLDCYGFTEEDIMPLSKFNRLHR